MATVLEDLSVKEVQLEVLKEAEQCGKAVVVVSKQIHFVVVEVPARPALAWHCDATDEGMGLGNFAPGVQSEVVASKLLDYLAPGHWEDLALLDAPPQGSETVLGSEHGDALRKEGTFAGAGQHLCHEVQGGTKRCMVDVVGMGGLSAGTATGSVPSEGVAPAPRRVKMAEPIAGGRHCEQRGQRAPECSDQDWQVVARWRAKKARDGKRALAWQRARQRWQANVCKRVGASAGGDEAGCSQGGGGPGRGFCTFNEWHAACSPGGW